MPEFQFQSLWNRAESFDRSISSRLLQWTGFNPFRTGRGLSTYLKRQFYLPRIVSIPLEQGEVFRPKNIFCITGLIKVSIPLEQGRVFRLKNSIQTELTLSCFNPFGAGQGLSTVGVVWCLGG